MSGCATIVDNYHTDDDERVDKTNRWMITNEQGVTIIRTGLALTRRPFDITYYIGIGLEYVPPFYRPAEEYETDERRERRPLIGAGMAEITGAILLHSIMSLMIPDIRWTPSTLPNEILIAVVDEVDRLGAPETLCSLLLVSRRFHAIAIRLIYKDLLLSLFHSKQIHAFAYLSRNITTNPGIQFITSFIFEYRLLEEKPCFTTRDDRTKGTVELILPYLVNVSRLHITFWPFAVFNPQALCLLPPRVQLTHLLVDRSIHLTSLSLFLARSHPLLESIVIRPEFPSSVTCKPLLPTDPKLSACALCPRLRRIEAPIEDLLLFEDAPPSVVNLGVLGQYPYRAVKVGVREHILQTFPSLRTLSFEGTNFATGVAPLLPRLPNLEYLSLDDSSMGLASEVQKLSILSLVKLKYLRLVSPSRDPLDIARMYFGALDALLILEVADLKTSTRVHRDSMDVPLVYNTDVCDPKWLQWWEPAEGDVLNAGKHDMFFFITKLLS
ncbi:hypothetical protein BDN71DRAFT_1513044 [Pleurotus eryngii]|uniref:F-box domain-containing protein n=1 Tax=Pleurotus eryngii TaxID=5323 RepID=A0A9P5ZJX4_PLEER|nr:hypothetical protein BDN71DRAFT_1513044 [Pleurotus eryngii]